MAALTLIRGDRGDGRRGQLLLVGGLAVAVALVGLALILNSSVYVENVANRENSLVGDEGPVLLAADVRRAVGRVVVGGNRNRTDYPARVAAVRAGVDEVGGAVGQFEGINGRTVTVRAVPDGLVEGRLVRQDGDAAFTEPVSGDDDWTVVGATSPRRLRRFSMNVTRGSLVSGLGGATFRAVVTDDDGQQWRVFVFRDGSDVVVRTEDPGGALSPACRVAAERATVDLSGARLGGDHCEALDVFESSSPSHAADADPPYAVEFRRTESGGSPTVRGTYRFVARGGGLSPDYAGDPDTSSERVVYSALVDVTYRSPDTEGSFRLRVAPGEQRV